MVKDIHDVIKQAKFGDDRFRGSGVVAGQISAFPIDFAGRPYNTLTLPCERVIAFSTPPPLPRTAHFRPKMHRCERPLWNTNRKPHAESQYGRTAAGSGGNGRILAPYSGSTVKISNF